MSRFIAFLYGLASYVIFFVTFLYALGFVEGLVVPKTIDSGAAGSVTDALVANILLMSLFAIQHSVMRDRSSSNGGRSGYRSRSSAARTCCSRASRLPYCAGSGGRCPWWCGTLTS